MSPLPERYHLLSENHKSFKFIYIAQSDDNALQFLFGTYKTEVRPNTIQHLLSHFNIKHE